MRSDAIVISDDSATEDEDILETEREHFIKRTRGKGKAKQEDHQQSAVAVQQEEQSQDSIPSTSASSGEPPLSSLFGGANQRRQLEIERRRRQRERRIAQGLPPESDSDSEQSAATTEREFKPLPTKSNTKSRSYVSQVDHTPSQPQPQTSSYPSRVDTNVYPEASTGRHNISGLGSSTGTKPALRRILASDRFYQGTVKRSYNQYTNDGVPLADFILPTTKSNSAGLRHALVASYVYDFDWLASILPDQTSASVGRKAEPPPTLTFVAPQGSTSQKLDAGALYAVPTPGWALLGIKDIGREYVCMHMKFIFLFYGDRFRMVILTGNLIEYDWNTLENAAYIQDFPILPGSRRDTSSDTYDQLSSIMKSLSVPAAHPALKELSRYDLTKGPTIIASAATTNPAPYRGFEEINKWGLGRLSQCVRKIMGGKKVGEGGVRLEAQGSSMGSYSMRWMQQFHLAASGLNLSKYLPLPSSANSARKLYEKAIGSSSTASQWPPVKILFPTKTFVENVSKAGPSGGGCHYGKPERFESFKELCHDVRSTRHDGILMHQKGLLGLSHMSSAQGNQPVGWVYMGSTNFTMNAWGNISTPSSKSSSSTTPQMIMNNWELGLILPVYQSDLQPEAELSTMASSAICWKRPPKAYRLGDVPWSPRS
ncbi:unnamed protein product [Sympodiomycopsis kandeliae]